jgi:hypothetical protein
MRQLSHRSSDPSRIGDSSATTPARETDPLLESSAQSYLHQSGSIRVRRSSRSPSLQSNQHFGSNQRQREQMNSPLNAEPTNDELQNAYEIAPEPSRSGSVSMGDASSKGSSTRYVSGSRSIHSLRSQKNSGDNNNDDHPPLLEIPEQIYGVRKAALQVLKPLTKTWVSRYSIVISFQTFQPLIFFTYFSN